MQTIAPAKTAPATLVSAQPIAAPLVKDNADTDAAISGVMAMTAQERTEHKKALDVLTKRYDSLKDPATGYVSYQTLINIANHPSDNNYPADVVIAATYFRDNPKQFTALETARDRYVVNKTDGYGDGLVSQEDIGAERAHDNATRKEGKPTAVAHGGNGKKDVAGEDNDPAKPAATNGTTNAEKKAKQAAEKHHEQNTEKNHEKNTEKNAAKAKTKAEAAAADGNPPANGNGKTHEAALTPGQIWWRKKHHPGEAHPKAHDGNAGGKRGAGDAQGAGHGKHHTKTVPKKLDTFSAVDTLSKTSTFAAAGNKMSWDFLVNMAKPDSPYTEAERAAAKNIVETPGAKKHLCDSDGNFTGDALKKMAIDPAKRGADGALTEDAKKFYNDKPANDASFFYEDGTQSPAWMAASEAALAITDPVKRQARQEDLAAAFGSSPAAVKMAMNELKDDKKLYGRDKAAKNCELESMSTDITAETDPNGARNGWTTKREQAAALCILADFKARGNDSALYIAGGDDQMWDQHEWQKGMDSLKVPAW